jgi:hypothetical protein
MFKKYTFGDTYLIDDLWGAIKEFADQELPNARILMAARDYSSIRVFHRDGLEMEISAEKVRVGRMATVKGTDILISKLVPPGACYMVSETESATLHTYFMVAQDPERAEEIAINFKRLVNVWDKAGEKVIPVVG